MGVFNLIVAMDNKRGIGKDGKIPWHIPADLQFFKGTTLNSTIIMGRKTWDYLPIKPLEDRVNIVITKTRIDNILTFNSLESALAYTQRENHSKIFIIGGEQLYNEAIHNSYCVGIYATRILKTYDCDTFFPNISQDRFYLSEVSKFKEYKNIFYRNYVYNISSIKYFNRSNKIEYTNQEEFNYLYLMNKIIKNGLERDDRTGVGTLSLFGEKLSYDISDTFPILTTRKQFFRGIFEELMFYLRGQTDNNILTEKGLHIWTNNTTREFLDKRGLTDYEEGDMGETYGFNFRHFGGKYTSCKDNDGGFDQLEEVIRLIKNDPTSRRIIISLWNPNTNNKASLPSCMCFYQFYVDTKNKRLNVQVYIRSSDYLLANNWNTCTASLFVYLLCNTKGIDLTPGKVDVIMGDVHLYKNHLDIAKELINQRPKPFPKLHIKVKKDKITEFEYDDIKLLGYEPMTGKKVKMAI